MRDNLDASRTHSWLDDAKAFFVADVHWQPAATQASVDLGPFGDFLSAVSSRAAGATGTELYVLGDLFDFWFERGNEIFPFFLPHVEALAAARAAGVRIHLLAGNRDFTCGRAIRERAAVELAGERIEIELSGKKVSLQHGDLLCTRDWRYQTYRRLIRSGALRAMMRTLPMSAVESAIRRMRQASAAEIRRKKPASMSIPDAALSEEARAGVDIAICGHVHRVERREVQLSERTMELITLGPWSASSGSALVWNGDGLTLETFRR